MQPLPIPRARRHTLFAMLATALSLTMASGAHAQSDVVSFKNGDRLTGEIKFLDRGKISFDTPATGIIAIEWDDVAQLVSTTYFEVTLQSGQRLFGSLAASAREAALRLEDGATTMDFAMPTVVRITPIESTIVDRLQIKVDLGYSLAKANNTAQTNSGLDIRYRAAESQIRFNYDGATSNSENEAPSTRVFGNLSYQKFLEGRSWNPFGVGQFERNDELGISRRVTLGGGMSHWLRDTNASRIAFSGGLVYSTEDDFGATESISDTEALVALDLEWFRYDSPKLDFSTQMQLYKRLSGSQYARGNLDTSLSWELFRDFFWSFSFYYSFDRQTIEGTGEATSDYGSFTSLGWKF